MDIELDKEKSNNELYLPGEVITEEPGFMR